MVSKAVGPISLRDRQKAQTREHLLDTAAVLFAEQGYNETTIEQIARAAGSSRATVYSYFSTKEDILRTLAVEMWENTEDTYRAFAELPEWSETAIRGWLEHVADEWDRTIVRIRVVVESLSRELHDDYLRHHRSFVTTLTAATERWRAFPRAEAEIRALLLIAQMEAFFGTWYIRGWKINRKTALDTLADVWCATLKVD
jgi:AcrR family transcriptional regulator